MTFYSLRSKIIACLVFSAAAISPLVTHAQVPETIAYQGYLTDPDGIPFDEPVNLAFSLYAEAEGGTPVWTETQLGTTVSDGVFSVQLGSSESLADVSFGEHLWLGVKVNGGEELAPRTAFTSVPYALSLRGLRIESADDPSTDGPNFIAGSAENTVADGVAGSTVSGGGSTQFANSTTGHYGSVGGGRGNTAGIGATVGGGLRNTADGNQASVGGGRQNSATNSHATVAGGGGNTASGNEATVSGGTNNVASGFRSTVGGGFGNQASGVQGTIGGGGVNRADSPGATVGGGVTNVAGDLHATVGGGAGNRAEGRRSTVPGGLSNHARGDFSFAAGYHARALHAGTFVWSDNSLTDADSLLSTSDHQFLIRAAGGVGVGTNAPTSPLTVAGIIESTEGGFKLPDGTIVAGRADLGSSDSGSGEATVPEPIYVRGDRVGIGTKEPSSPLTVDGVIETTKGGIVLPDGFRITDQSALGGDQSLANALTATDRNDVGIGTADPLARLDVRAASDAGTDLVLGEESGIIASNSSFSGADMFIKSNDAVVIQLDADNSGEDADFHIRDKDGNELLNVDEGGRVGIGTTNPSDHLQVDAPAGSDALRVRIDGTTRLRVHDNGGLSVGVNAGPPAAGLLVEGDIRLNQAQTRWYGVTGGEFAPDDNTASHNQTVECLGPATCRPNISIQLPHGARVTEVQAKVKDRSAFEDVRVSLRASTHDDEPGGGFLALLDTEGVIGDVLIIKTTNIGQPAVIDNEKYAYGLELSLPVGGDFSLHSVRITYTVDSPMP